MAPADQHYAWCDIRYTMRDIYRAFLSF